MHPPHIVDIHIMAKNRSVAFKIVLPEPVPGNNWFWPLCVHDIVICHKEVHETNLIQLIIARFKFCSTSFSEKSGTMV